MSTALYRRYRPDDFADVIGQEHVTDPLMAALEKNRVNHAYLFSGPRGCGKTTSARILARCLNCVHGPTAHPCGECDSCRDLQRGGPGSLDVIEIDAASHGGVDDARDLRERATFAPVRDRYKIFIIDEAHMVTSAGFNALLKIVEEPPEHIKFIFATTEPDKVIGTIRSRTHHYPFRLVPPEPLMAYLQELCDAENVEVAPGVLSLVARAGGGSVRDSLSVLDQLMAGAGEEGLDYELAVNLLGYTHSALLDDVVDALAAHDSATVFNVVDRVIQTGHDPRRFVEDLLERFRDLIIVKAMPDEASHIIRGLPEDQLARMRQQANVLGASELSRNADTTNKALTDMTGATSPRLHLELLSARLLLPASDHSERGMAARVDRIERHLNFASAEETPVRGSQAGARSGIEQQASAAVRGSSRPAERPRAAEQPQRSQSAAPQPEPTRTTAAPMPGVAAAPAPAASMPQAASPTPEEASNPAASMPPVPSSPAQSSVPETPQAPRNTPAASPDWGNTWGALEDEPAAPVRQPELPQQQQRPRSEQPRQSQTPPVQGPPAQTRTTQQRPEQAQPVQSRPDQSQPQQEPPAQRGRPQSNPAQSGGTGSVEMFRRAWPEIMNRLSEVRRAVWMAVEPNATVAGFDGQTLTIAFSNEGAFNNFRGREANAELLQRCIQDVLGVGVSIVAVSGGAAPAGGSGPKDRGREAPAQRPQEHVARPTNTPTSAPAAPRSGTAAVTPGAPADSLPRTTQEAPAVAPGQSTPQRSAAPAQRAAERPAPERPAPERREPGRPASAERPAQAERQAPAQRPARAERRTPVERQTPVVAEPTPPVGDAPSQFIEDAWQAAPDIEPWDPDGDPWAGVDGGDWEETPSNRSGESSEASAVVPEIEKSAPQVSAPATAPTATAPAAAKPATAAPAAAPAPARTQTSTATQNPVAPAPGGSAAPAAPVAPTPGASTGRPVAPPPVPQDTNNWGWESHREAMAEEPPVADEPKNEASEVPMSQRIAAKLAQEPAAANPTVPDLPRQAMPPARAKDNGVESAFVDDVPSDEDIMIEDSMLVGRAAVERVLDGKLIEARNLDGTPII
ncbi:DNA polymerase III subunit gamma and tau [Neomicrococcus lactis]|uniref:DNA polymerase III subunit gamma and tau n=1 Tax=Neomicrococcus lactis TaxID=732241 RepID=UPI00230136E6|nr:DNA polymerase III subunit gamma and tau [Neomicrococcus lactis]